MITLKLAMFSCVCMCRSILDGFEIARVSCKGLLNSKYSGSDLLFIVWWLSLKLVGTSSRSGGKLFGTIEELCWLIPQGRCPSCVCVCVCLCVCEYVCVCAVNAHVSYWFVPHLLSSGQVLIFSHTGQLLHNLSGSRSGTRAKIWLMMFTLVKSCLGWCFSPCLPIREWQTNSMVVEYLSSCLQ